MKSNDISYPTAITMAGKEISSEDGKTLYTECPACGNSLAVRAGSGVCLSDNACGFRRGGALDFLAYDLGGYKSAVEAAYPSLDASSTNHIVAEYSGERRLMEYLMRLHKRNSENLIDKVEIRILADRAGITDGDRNPNGVLFTSASETGEIFTILSEMGVTCPPQMQGPCIIIPYWDTLHSVSTLEVYYNRAKTKKAVHTRNAKWAWTGLHDAHPSDNTLVAHPTVHQALSAHKKAASLLMPHRHSVAYVRTGGDSEGWVEDKMVFAGTPDQWLACFPRWSYIDGFAGATFLLGSEQVGLDRAIADLALRSEPESFSGSRALVMLEGMRFEEGVAAKLLDTVFRSLGPRWFRDAEAILSRRLLTQVGRTSFFTSPAGYESVVGGDITRLTNFTLKLDDVVGFYLSSELNYRGEVRVGSSQFPVTITGTSLDSPSAMGSELQRIQILGGKGTTSDEDLVTIFNPKGFKDICVFLKRGISSLPRIRGARRLGWTPRLDEYQATGYAVRSGEVVDALYIPDSSTSFYPFEARAVGDCKIEKPNNVILQGIVAAMAGNMVRAQLALPYCPETALNESNTRAALGAMFEEMGQTKPVRITSILPKYLEVAAGHPILSTGINPIQISKARLNGVTLGEKGINLSGTSEEDARHAGKVLLKLLQELARKITAGDHIPYRERRSVVLEGRSAVEGADLINALFDQEWDVRDSRYRFVDLLLEERKELLDEAARQAGKMITITEDIAKGVSSLNDLELELSLLCRDIESKPGRIEVDSMSYSRLYENFYGTAPPIPAPEFPGL